VWDETAATWTGVLRYKGSQGQVVLRRPVATTQRVTNPFAGTWVSQRGPTDSCLHIAEESDGKLIGWQDNIPAPERIIVPRNMASSMPMMASYGSMAKVQSADGEQVTVELGAYTGMCCSHTFTAKVSVDGKLLEGSFAAGPNQSAQAVVWRRVSGDSCRVGR
jgi:hypothetical protein